MNQVYRGSSPMREDDENPVVDDLPDSFVRNINESDSETSNSDEDELVDDTDDDPDYHPGEQSSDDDILPGPSSSTSRHTSMKKPRLSRLVLINPLDDAELFVGC